MSLVRICEFSSQLFGGFQYKFDIATVESMDEIICLAVSQLRCILECHGFRELILKLDMIRWHVHSHTWDNIRTQNDVIWICDHCEDINESH